MVYFVAMHKSAYIILLYYIPGGIRLVDGDTPEEGRVELRYGSHWGTICHDGFGNLDALVCLISYI